MANLRIVEYTGIGRGSNDCVQAAALTNVEQAPILISGASTLSAAFAPKTRLIRVTAEAICSIYVGGTAPTATAGQSARFNAGQSEYFAVMPGDKLAVIADT